MRLFASKYVSKVRSAPSKDAPRIGYMRGGAVLTATTSKPLGFDACRKGWYELETGGFVCATTDAIAFSGKRLPERRSTQPNFDTPLPYLYAYTRTKDTPMYRRLPSDEEAALYEGYRIPGTQPVPSPESTTQPALDPPALDPTEASASLPSARSDTEPAAGLAADTSDDTTSIVPTSTSNASDPVVSPEPENTVPTLASLMGQAGSVLVRKMERGFYVSLDREIDKGARRYFQTQAAGYIPKNRLALVEGSSFAGVDLQAGEVVLPMGFVLSKQPKAFVLDSKGRLRGAPRPSHQYAFPITAEVVLRGKPFYVAPDGTHYPTRDVRRILPRDELPKVGAGEKWIDVDLSTQSLVAYEGDKPVYVTLVSTGRIKDELDPLRNFATPVGEFRITSKHLSATMDGDHAVDGPYSIEDVPYVMYFQLAYAMHTAFWHNSFGRPRSHGCINLAPRDAKWLFFWATPALPKSWHGVYPNEQNPGTRLFIRGETPKG